MESVLQKQVNDWSELLYDTLMADQDFKETFGQESKQFVINEFNKLGLECWLEHGEISAHLISDEKFEKALNYAEINMALQELVDKGLVSSFVDEDGDEKFFIPEEKRETIKSMINE